MYRKTFALFAAYNKWANERLYASAEAMPPDKFRADRGVFFRSMVGTLNHILAADRIWMRRFTGEGEAPTRLDAILFEDFAGLRRARSAEDDRIAAYVASLDDARFSSTFTYSPITDPTPVTQPLGPTLLHFFNHQTHHRGQAHAVLTGYGLDAPSLDLVRFNLEAAKR